MEHPVITNRISGLIYWLFLLGLGITQAVFNSYYHVLHVTVALLDGLIFALVLGVLGMATWYVVRYNDPDKSTAVQMLASHIAASLVFTAIWIIFSGIIAKTLTNDFEYAPYLSSQITLRIYAGLLFYVLLASVYYVYVYSQHNRERKLKEAEWQQQLREAQLKTLKSQINPHFLFNSLNSIASLTLTNPERAHAMVIALSDFYALFAPKASG